MIFLKIANFLRKKFLHVHVLLIYDFSTKFWVFSKISVIYCRYFRFFAENPLIDNRWPISFRPPLIFNIIDILAIFFDFFITGHGWPNHVKTLCTICVIVLSLCFLINLICMKASTITTKTK